MDRRGMMRALGTATIGASTLTPLIGQAATPIRQDAVVAFEHGVASGDPLASRVILWTRVSPEQAGLAIVDIDWEVATTPGFEQILRSGTMRTGPERDYTVKVDVTGLKPNQHYHYRFRCGAVTSPTGQTRTLPEGAQAKDMVLAVASCSFYSTGFFNAYREIARLDRVDLVLHLGDYIYDYGTAPDELGMSVGLKIGRIPTPAHETITLADYRERYACYRRDADLQAAHARAPWICVWDDHESANDSWMGGAQNHQPDEGSWADRRTAAVRAYYEWIPIRDPQAGRPFEAINRSFELGDIATLVMIETRLFARSRQLSISEDAPRLVFDMTDPAQPRRMTDEAVVTRILAAASAGAVPAPYAVRPDIEAFKKKLADPSRQLLGAEQEAWLQAEIAGSVKSGKRWQVIGNQVIMARTTKPDVVAVMGEERWQKARDGMAPNIRGLVEGYLRVGDKMPSGLDSWNGYPAARGRMDTMLAHPGAAPIVLTGDSHSYWVNELSGAPGERIAAEIGTTAISSSSFGDMLGGFDMGPSVAEASSEVVYNNQVAKGFTLVTLNRQEARVDLVSVSTVKSREYATSTIATFHVSPRDGGGIMPIRKA